MEIRRTQSYSSTCALSSLALMRSVPVLSPIANSGGRQMYAYLPNVERQYFQLHHSIGIRREVKVYAQLRA